MDSSSFFTGAIDTHLTIDKTKPYKGNLSLFVTKYISPAKISVIVPRTISVKIFIKPNFANYFNMRVDTFHGVPEVNSRFFSKVELSSLNLERNQLLEIYVYPKKIEYANTFNSEICSIEFS